jgi:hypothetical protein
MSEAVFSKNYGFPKVRKPRNYSSELCKISKETFASLIGFERVS